MALIDPSAAFFQLASIPTAMTRYGLQQLSHSANTEIVEVVQPTTGTENVGFVGKRRPVTSGTAPVGPPPGLYDIR